MAEIGEIKEWRDEQGRRHIRIEGWFRVYPAVRQNRATRWGPRGGSAERYNASRALIRAAVALALKELRMQPFGPVRLGFASSFVLCRDKMLGERRRRSVETVDLSNLEKALEDAMIGVLYPDDRWIFARGPGHKQGGPTDRFTVEVWEL